MLVVLRVLGGVGLGGEWGGAVLLSVEHAPPGRRGFYGSFPQVGSPAGFLLATAVFAVVTRLPADQFLAWGWCIPFLLSAVLIVIGLFVRARIGETPAFVQVRQQARSTRIPLVEVLRTHPKQVLLSIGAFLVTSGGYYVYATYMVSYGTKQLHLSQTTMLLGGIVFSVGGLVGSLVFSAVSDHVGRRPVFIAAAAFTALYAFPLFWLVGLRVVPLVLVAQGISGLANGALYGLMGSLTSEMFDPRVRYTGASIGQQVSAAAVGGTTPLIVTALAAAVGGYRPAPAWLAVLALISLTCVVLLTETAKTRHATGAAPSQVDSPAIAGDPIGPQS
jgi:MFS family permease